MRHLKTYESSEWINKDDEDPTNQNKIWSEIEDILTPISDDVELIYTINNFKRPVTSSKSNILIKKDWSQIPNSREGERYFFVRDVSHEINHLCSRFSGVINQIQLFRQRAKNPVRYTPSEFIKDGPDGSVFLIAITLKIQKEGARFIPPN